MLKEFKKFALRGSVIDLAIGIIIGSSFSSVVNSLVEDIIMPPIGLLLSDVDFSNIYILLKEGSFPKPYASLSIAEEAGAVTLNVGLFINSLISFLIIAFVVFLIIKGINNLRKEEEPEVPSTKECMYCMTEIPINAVRCPNCTSKL